ncbi:hypothetical protein [Streptomyces sp. NPDC018059]|uniref:hypothetical protein n=1 Tax=Streptomyces sp. NPDC018059 TaxID=3365041 RepID=UPI00379CCA07
MRTDLTLRELNVPLRALRMALVEFPELSAPSVHVSPVFPERLELALHDNFASFEPWRRALGIAPEDVHFRSQSAGETWVLLASADYGGATVRLVAYAEAFSVSQWGECGGAA